MGAMTDDLIDDLKQFIEATISQGLANVATKDDIATLDSKIASLDSKVATLDSRIAALDTNVNGRLDEVNLRLDTIADAQAEMLHDHEERITRLETRAA